MTSISKFRTFFKYSMLIAIAIGVAAPFGYALITSLKTNQEALSEPLKLWPSQVQWSNYIEIFKDSLLVRQFLNSVIVSGAVTIISVITCTLAGYSFAKFRYRGRNTYFLLTLATLMMPIQVILVPLYDMAVSFGWLNTYWGLVIPAGTSAFGVFLMRQYIQSVPNELLDAARIDGANEFRIFWTVVLPLIRPGLAALTIFVFTNDWNSLLWPVLVADKEEMFTMPLAVASLQGAYATDFPQLAAVALLTAAPLLIVFFILQRQFIRGMALSGLKG